MVSEGSTESENITYPFKRNYIASARLNLNHFWMRSLAGYLLHPKITTNGNLRIIDVGAGTGIWACEVAALLPSATIDVVDISADQYPPKGFRPANTQWWTTNCFEPFPEEHLGKFDVVHARFLQCIIKDEMAEGILKNFLTLLKPGGYIQWFEPLPHSAKLIARNGGAPTPAMDKLIAMWKKQSPDTTNNWIATLPHLFKDQHLSIIAEDHHNNPDYYLPIAAQSAFMGLSEYLHADPAIEKFLEEMAAEHGQGAFVDVTWACFVGRKEE